MAKLEVMVHENTGATKDTAPYLGSFVSKGNIDFAALAEQLSKRCGLPAIQIEAILRGSFSEFAKLQREDPVRINFDGGCVYIVMKGTFNSSDARFDSDKNSLELVWLLSDEIRNALVNETPKIVTGDTSTKVRLDTVADVETPRPYQLIHGTKKFKCTGINLVTTDEGAEVYLENGMGVKIPCIVDEIFSKQEFNAHVSTAVEPGDYKLVVKSRGGDAEGQLQTSFRKVKYLAVDAPTPVIDYLYSSGHEDEHDAMYEEAAFAIKGTNLATAAKCELTFKDKNGKEHSTEFVNTDADFAASDTLIEINNYTFFDGIRGKCDDAGSVLDTAAGVTAKVTFSDGTVVAHDAAIAD